MALKQISLKIYIATHAQKPVLSNDLFVPIQVNAENNPPIDGVQVTDNTGDNISIKNPNYCELTALYWMWKNQTDEDILGLFHYRRILNTYQNFLIKPHRNVLVNSNSKIIKKLEVNPKVSKKNIRKWLSNNELIAPYAHHLKKREPDQKKINLTLKQDYYQHHIAYHFDVMVEVLLQKYPDYKSSVQKWFYEDNTIIGTNMFIASRNWANPYCEWLFDILFEVEKHIDIPDDPYQKRVFGFMSERLMTLYLKHNRNKVKYLQELKIEELF